MKKVLLTLAAVAMAAVSFAQTPVFYENFDNTPNRESYIFELPQGWTSIKNDNQPNNSQVNIFSDAWAVINFSESGKCATCITATSTNQGIDRWLITPAITVETGNVVEFLAGGGGGPETISVLVSTNGGTNMSDFTETIIDHRTISTDTWIAGSLAAYAGQTVHIAIVAHTGDEYLLRVDEFKVFSPASHEIAAEALNLPSYAASGSDVTITGTIVNNGSENLTDFDMEYTVNGGTPVTQHVSGINVAYHQFYDFTFTTPMNEATSGTYTVAVTISNPNGEADFDATNNTISGNVAVYSAADARERTVLIEQFTGNQCGYCPAGADRIAQARAQFTGKSAWITHHAGYNQDALSNSFSSAMTFLYGGGGTFAPAVGYDRTNFTGEEGPVGSVASASDILATLNQANAVPCFLELSMNNVNFNEETRQITGTVNGHFTSNLDLSNAKLMVYVIEDSIILTQADYYNGTQKNYKHMHTVRTSITGTYGEAINVNNGDFSYNIDYTLPAMTTITGGHYVNSAWRTHLVAFVYNYDSRDVNNCAVYNVAESQMLNASYVGIDEAGSDVVLNIFPNPATSFVTIEAGQQIEEVKVMNTLGQVVYTNNKVEGESINITTEGLSTGMYIATVKTATGISTKRFNVVK